MNQLIKQIHRSMHIPTAGPIILIAVSSLFAVGPVVADAAFGKADINQNACSYSSISHPRTVLCSSGTTESIDMTSTTKASSASADKAEQKNAKFWDKMANGYAKQPIADEESYRKKLELTRQYLNPKTSRVLEFGCGTGGTALLHAPYAKHIHATDLSAEMIAIAENKAQEAGVANVKFEQTSIERLDTSNTNYNVVMGMSILHLVPDTDAIIAKVHQLLPEGGVFVSSTICLGNMPFYVRHGVRFGITLGLLPQLQIFTADELKDKITKAGFEVEEEIHPDKVVFFIARKK